MFGAVLPREFYLEPTPFVARSLRGKIVVVTGAPEPVAGRIVEAEAYLGARDPASHAYRGKTARNASMFGDAGHAYVYFSYGVHWMLNFVTQPAGVGEAVLIRAIEPVAGIEAMRVAAGAGTGLPDYRLANGPGKLARALGITRARHDGVDLCDPRGGICVCDDGSTISDSAVTTSRRIGISSAVESPLRFYVTASPAVSRK